MPERLIEERFDVLGRQVTAATDALDADRVERAATRVAEDNKSKWWRRAAIGAVVLAPVSLAVGIGGVVAAVKAQDAADKAQTAVDTVNDFLASSRVNSCNNYNEQVVPNINALNDASQGLLIAFSGRSENPETQALIDQQLAAYEGVKVLYRDCSPDGLDAFSSGTGGYLPPGVAP